MTLTREQRRAVEHDSHVVLTACPGSGKTRTLVAKLRRCIAAVRGTPRRVACITYTNAAINEIEHRLRAVSQNGDDELCEVCTIHTFCLNHVLRAFYWKLPNLAAGFQISSPDSEDFILAAKEVSEKHFLNNGAVDNFQHLHRTLDGSPICPEFITEAAALEFWQILEEKGHLDFCSVVFWTFYLLQTFPSIAEGVASRFEWILVDEFQDTSDIQVELFSLIATLGRTTFFAVGDPHQSIFGFAGARPDLMDVFQQRLNARADFKLLENFRSSKHIIDHAERLIGRTPPMVASGQFAAFDLEPLHVASANRFDGITDYFLPMIAQCDIPYGETAILAPSWFTLVHLARELRNYGVPVVGPGARPYKSQRLFARLAEQICAYIERPRPERIQEIEKELFIFIANLNGKADYTVFSYDGRRVVFSLIALGKSLKEESESAVRWLQHAATGFGTLLCSEGMTSRSRVGVLEESASLMIGDMTQRGVDTANISLADLGMFACPDANLKLLTLHAAKGREFDAVALVDLHEGSIPNWRVRTDQGRLEESKRQFYVGLTRARKVLMYITDRRRDDNVPSRFLKAVRPAVASMPS